VNRRTLVPLTALLFLLGASSVALMAGAAGPDAPGRFALASIRIEQNVTDRDVEIVIEAKGGEDGLAKFTVVSPDGRTLIEVSAPDASTLGMRQFRFESPEPKNIESLKSAYPEGVYRFSGVSAAGAELQGEARLSHRLPGPAALARPRPDARNVPINSLEIAWSRVENLAAHVVYVEQPDLGVEITARVAGSATSFAVPDGFLVAGTEYQVGLGTVTAEGNMSFVETTIRTAEKE